MTDGNKNLYDEAELVALQVVREFAAEDYDGDASHSEAVAQAIVQYLHDAPTKTAPTTTRGT